MNSFLKNSILIMAGVCLSLAARSQQCTPTIGSVMSTQCNWAIYATFGGSNYQWFRNGAQISGATSSSITVTQGGSYTLLATVSGCMGTSMSSPIVIGNPPVASISLTAGSTNFCPGAGSATFSAQTGTGFSYQWWNGGPISGATSSSYTATVAGSYSCKVSTSACFLMSNTIQVTSPSATLTIAATNTTIQCGAPPVTLYIAGPGGSGYQWYLNSSPISGATSSSYNPTQGGNYYLTAVICGTTVQSNTIAMTGTGSPSINAQGSIYVCQPGGTVTYVVTNYDATATYQWKNSGDPTTLGTGQTYAATQSGNYYVVMTKNGFSCNSNTIPANFFTINTTITPPGPLMYCPSSSLVLTATPGYMNYFWYKDGVAISGPPVSNTCSVTGPGTYTLTISHYGCSQSASPVVVTAGSTSVPSINGLPNGCLGSSPNNHYATETGKTGYVWTVSGGTIINGQGTYAIDVNYNTLGAQQVSVTYTGCVTAPTIKNVTVNPLPVPTFIQKILTPCNGSTGNVYSTESGMSGYSWQVSGGTINAGQGTSSISVTWTTPGANTVKVSYSNGLCTSQYSSLDINVLPSPVAQVASDGLPVFCDGGSVQLVASSADGYSFQWYKDGGQISGANTSQYQATTAGSYTVVIALPNGCSKTSDPFPVTVSTRPNATITPTGPTSICQGQTTVLNASTGTSYTYQWKNEQGNIAGATSPSYSATQTGVYTLVTKVGSCSATSTGLPIVVNPLPVVSIVSSGATTFCENKPITLLAVSDADSYQWENNSGNISGEVTNSYVVHETNTFKVRATKGSCSLESNAISSIKKPQPSPVSSFTGPTTLPAGDKRTYTITGNSTDDDYLWNTPAGTNIVYGDQRRTSATIGFNQLGERVISVVAQKNGCDSEPVEKTLQVIEAVTSVPSQIPTELKVSPDNQVALPLTGPSLRLNSFNQNDIKPVFDVCQAGQYWAGFQLYYDALADLNTVPQWTALVDITLMQGPSTILWTRSLQVDMTSQTFISTIFHDTPITCTDDYRFKIKTKSTLINGVQAPEQNIYLKVLLYKRMLDTFNPISNLSLNPSLTNGNLQVTWTYDGYAVKNYDLEWVMIEDHEMFTPSSSAAIDAFKFKEPVRVTVGPADFFYKHHAFYPSGRVWFRARAVGYNPAYPGHVIPGQWFYGSDTPLTISNPETLKNWQLQTVFAEEGKYKKVMNYFDGTFRQRQSQTNLSTDDLTLVGEALYDFEGRKAVDILPVPTADLSLHYQSGFNAFAGSDPTVLANTSAIQKKFHYDNKDLVNSVLSQTTGAGKYYSEANTIGSPSMGPKDYVPDADGYVYSQTEFLNDGTGRVSRQSGVGELFRMEGGHNTRNYYTEAARVELTRLFGPNVGNASHYKKNVTVDPNGQASVSYVDQTGKVIATALAGTPPANVDALPSYNAASNPFTVDLKSKNVIKDGTSKTIHKFLNEAVNTSYTFNYNLSAAGVTVPGFNCQACTYDFAITITDPNGALLDLDTITGNESGTTKRYQRNNLSAACGAPSPLSSVQFKILLADIGDYTITKTLTAHELTFDQMKTVVQLNPDVQQNILTIANSYVIDPADCAICTATCPEINGAISDAINEIADLDCSNIMQNIIQDLKDRFSGGDPNYVPLDTDIQNHVLYCKYTLCTKNKASDIFNKQLVRIDRWSVASNATYNYQNLVTIGSSADPFYNNEDLSGYANRADMQSRINSIVIASKNGTTFYGSLSQITDPDNANYKINDNGQQDPGGFHILYYSLMKQRASLGETEYANQLDQQRWTLFRSFYLDQKRKNKLTIYEYNSCAEARKELQIIDDISSTSLISEDKIATAHNVDVWGQSYNSAGKGIDVNISDPELETWIASLAVNCKCKFTPTEVASMTSSLRNYFNKSNATNFLRQILISDVGVDSDLIAVQGILNNYGCNLGSVAEQSYVTCKSYATYTSYGPNLISNPTFSGCPVNANINSSCSGWTVAYGTPYLMGDGGFQLDASNCSQDALMNTFTSPLVPGQTYKLSFKYLTSSTSPGSVFSWIRLSSSTGFGVPTGGGTLLAAQNVVQTQNVVQPQIAIQCPSMPTVLSPDNVTINGTPTPTVWTNPFPPTSYTNYEVTFTATQASKYIFFYQTSYTPATITIDAIFKDVSLVAVGSGTAPFCKEYNPLPSWAYTPDWQAAIDLCNQHATDERAQLIEFATNKYVEQQVSAYSNIYRTNCINSAAEQLNYSYAPKEYHYTLYYYDQANNLVQTVPPVGVIPLNDTDANSATPPSPQHKLITRYQYTSINQLTWQCTPDAGVSEFVYDKKSQLRVSHNAQQTIDGKYSYTKYDEQGRITEVGELVATDPLATISQYVDDPRFPTTGVPGLPTYATADVTNTHYDNPNDAITSKLLQQNLRARVSWVGVANQNSPDKSVTYYSYDIHGNVKSLLQQIPGLEVKRTDYVYDLISGKVNYVFYQFGKTDQFIHKYTYDADNRIQTASTSSDAYLWFKEASYKYYAHGPLARTEVGEYRVQGQDYYYTLQGWIKGVNMPFDGDPGADGVGASKVGKDVYAYTLGYYQNDYKASNASVILSDTRDQQWARYNTLMGNTGLYNGNISWMTTDLAKIGEVNASRVKGMQAMLYRYDQLHRIKKSQSLTAYTSGSGFATRTATPAAYDENYSYDANGNILTLQRYDGNTPATLMDDFQYKYYANSNRLMSVRPITRDTTYTGAITTSNTRIYRNITINNSAYVPTGSQVKLEATDNIFMGEAFHSEGTADFFAHILGDGDGIYNYDAIGNLIEDKEQAMKISWTPYGKVREVRKKDNTQITSFLYDAAGNRVSKNVVNSGTTTTTHYVRDASGNVMGVYTNTVLTEQPVYGSARLGQYKGGVAEAALTLGKRNYELSNHLGNVLAVITDNVSFQGAIVSAKVISSSDYYPFGLEMKGRSYTDPTASYRYGFNGKEKDNSFASTTEYDYGFRIYNPEIAKFLSVDPLARKYPELTPYQFASNRPIDGVDLDGLEFVECKLLIDNGKPKLEVTNIREYKLFGWKYSDGLFIEVNYKGETFQFQENTGGEYDGGFSYNDFTDFDEFITDPEGYRENVVSRVQVLGEIMEAYVYTEALFPSGGGPPPPVNIKNKDLLQGGKRLPNEKLKAAPSERGKSPTGEDGKPVELHHRKQTEDGPIDEKTMTEHRGKGNFKKNHKNTGGLPSKIDRKKFDDLRKQHWQKEWDSGRFKNLEKK